MDLRADVAKFSAAELAKAGYAANLQPSDDALKTYLNVLHRRVPIRPRRVHKPFGYSVDPPSLLLGEQSFVAAVRAGNDLRPYQSAGLAKPTTSDQMLNDFGIQHFHLGIGPHPTQPLLKARTGPLLYALVAPDDLYCIGVFPHGAWSQQRMLDILHAEWPHTLERFAVRNTIALAQTVTDDDRTKMRKANINAPTQRPDGTIHMNPGGGATLTGGSVSVMMALNKLQRTINDLEKQIREHLERSIAAGDLAEPIIVSLKFDNSEARAVVDGDRYTFKLGNQLALAPL
jgi:hypothetical protein